MKRAWQLGNILALAFALLGNYLVGAQLLGMPSIADISSTYSTLLTPAGYAFSIWSLIYVLLTVLVMFQARDILRPQAGNDLPQKMGPYFIIASICNGLWPYVFVNEWLGVSVIVLGSLVVSLMALMARLKIALSSRVPPVTIACVWWPIMVYTGWVMVASVVNAASWLSSKGVVLSEGVACGVLIVLAALLLVILVQRSARELVLASAWGIGAIGVQQMQVQGSDAVMVVAYSSVFALLVAVSVHGYKNRRKSIAGKLAAD